MVVYKIEVEFKKKMNSTEQIPAIQPKTQQMYKIEPQIVLLS